MPVKYRKLVGLGLTATLILLCSKFWQLHALRDAVSMLPVEGMSLELNWAYILLAPLFNSLDYLSFLSLSQHKAVMLAIILLPVLLQALAVIQEKKSPFQALLKLGKVMLISVLLLLALYAVAALMPRAMSSLQVDDKDILLVDFHSHTHYSWDANSSFSAEKNRLWHEKSGFHAAFITDHKSFAGVVAAQQHNPEIAGEGVLLLEGIETAYQQEAHVMALCASRENAQESTFHWEPIVGGSGACQPLLIQANPGPVENLEAAYDGGKGVLGIEIHDAAPVGLEEIKHRQLLLDKAKQLNIAVVYGSDNHGWAFAASGWSLLRIPAWQTMSAAKLALAITELIRHKGFSSVQVVERNMLLPAENIIGHVLMPVRIVWRMLRSISDIERFSWFLWSWLLLFLRQILRS